MFKPKVASKDFEESMLPSNRKEVFFDVLKHHYGKLIALGLIILLFALPMHLYAIGEDFYQASLLSTLSSTPTAEESRAVIENILTFSIIRNLVNIPLFMLLSIALAGASRLIRQLVWQEPVSFFEDFFIGIKQNFKQFIILGLITGILSFLCSYIEGIASTTVSELNQYLAILPRVIFILLLAPIAGFAQVSISCYSNRLRDNLKIGRVCYFGAFFKTLLALIVCLIPFIPELIPNIWAHMLGRVISTIIVPFIYLGWILFSMSRLDVVVNKKLHPELVRRGLINLENKEVSNN